MTAFKIVLTEAQLRQVRAAMVTKCHEMRETRRSEAVRAMWAKSPGAEDEYDAKAQAAFEANRIVFEGAIEVDEDGEEINL